MSENSPGEKKYRKVFPYLDNFVNDGEIQVKMGEYYNLTNERMRQVLHEKGVYDIWKMNNRKYDETRKGRMTGLANALLGIAYKKAGNEADRDILRWMHNKRPRKYDEEIYEFFRNYEDAKKKGNFVPLLKLSEGKIPFHKLRILLADIGKKPLKRSKSY